MTLPAVAVGGASAWHLAESYRRAFEARLQDTARALAMYLDSEIEARIALAVALASSPPMERDDLAAFRAWARGVGEQVGGWVAVNDVGPGHRQLVNTALPEGAPLPPPSPPGEGAWQVIRRVVETGRPAVSDFFVGRATGRPLVAVAAPVLRRDEVARVVVLVMDLARLSERLRAMGPSDGAFASVADNQGRIVARSRDHERLVGMAAPARSIPPEERARGVFWSRSSSGRSALFSAQPLKAAPGWTLAVAEPYARYRANWLGPLAILGAGAAAALGLGLVAAAEVARRVLRPVRALVDRAEAIAGDGVPQPLAAPPAAVAEFEALRAASERAEAVLAAREAEFRAMFETAAAGVAEVDARSWRYLRVNRRFCEITGRAEADLVGRLGPDDVWHPDDLGLRPSVAAVAQGGEAETECRILRPDGTTVWARASAAVSSRDAVGRPLRAVTVVQDVTERRRAEEARALLAREVDHRAKNVLAVVQATLRLTPKEDAAAYAAAVEGRVAALARAHTLLAQASWSGADLRSLAEAELRAFLPGGHSEPAPACGARLDGPAVILSPAAVQPFSMVLHELATNAAKHGALSTPGGLAELSWSVDAAAGLLRLRWVENGGPPVPGPPARRGFGTRVVEATVRDQLGGSVRKSWEAPGLVCAIEVPLARARGAESPRKADTGSG